MKVELKLFASLARDFIMKTGSPVPDVIEVNEKTTIKELLERYMVPLDNVKLIFLNGTHASGDELLQDGDRLGVFPPIAGG